MKVLAAVFLILCALGAIRVAVDISWENRIFSLLFRIGPFKLHMGKSKGGKTASDKKEKRNNPSQKENWNWLKNSFLSNGFELLCKAVAVLRVDILKIHYTAASSDPASAAMVYGIAGTAMETLGQVGEKRVSHLDLHADVDFETHEPSMVFRILVYLRLYRILPLLLWFGIRLGRDYFRYRKERRAEHG